MIITLSDLQKELELGVQCNRWARNFQDNRESRCVAVAYMSRWGSNYHCCKDLDLDLNTGGTLFSRYICFDANILMGLTCLPGVKGVMIMTITRIALMNI